MIVYIFIFGLIIGSFINCFIWRLRQNESLWGRSYCPKCRKQIDWYDNVPVISYILLKGKCRHCKQKISLQYPIIELVTAILFSFAFYFIFGNVSFYDMTILNFASIPWFSVMLLIRDWIFIFSLLVIFIYDLRWQEIPMFVIWVAGFLLLLLNIFIFKDYSALIISSVVGLSFFLLQYIITSKKGLGEGDIWLGLFLGIYFADWQMLVLALFIAYLIGAIISLYLLKRKKSIKSKIALGPFLVLGSIIVFFFGNFLLNWYIGLLACC